MCAYTIFEVVHRNEYFVQRVRIKEEGRMAFRGGEER